MTTHHTKSNRDAMLNGNLSRFNLIAHQPHGIGIGADEDEIIGLAGFGQFGTLRKKAVTRVYGICTRVKSRVDNFSDV